MTILDKHQQNQRIRNDVTKPGACSVRWPREGVRWTREGVRWPREGVRWPWTGLGWIMLEEAIIFYNKL